MRALSRLGRLSPSLFVFAERRLPASYDVVDLPVYLELSVSQHVDGGLQLAEELEQLPVQVRLDVVVDVLTMALYDRPSEPAALLRCSR